MVSRQPTFDQLRQAVRLEVCAHCPFRRGRHRDSAGDVAWRCEGDCPVLEHLPTFLFACANLDPMFGNHEKVIENTIDQIVEAEGEGTGGVMVKNKSATQSPLQYHRRRLVRVLGRLLNP